MSEKLDFVQTMKDWRRMCKHYSDESMKDGQHSCVDMCPLGHNTACGMIEDALDSDIEVMAKEVAKWAADHPEPVYPTWEEWLQSVGVMESSEGLLRRIKGQLYIDGIPAHAVPTAKVLQPIDADIAQKLGLQPKEE